MKLEGSIALVTGAETVIGAAIVRGLLARDAAKVYAATNDGGSELHPGAFPLSVDLERPAQVDGLVRELVDVTLLINCHLIVEHSASLLRGADTQALDSQSSSVGSTLKLIDAFAPVLAANGGGAVVNVLAVLCADRLLEDTSPGVVRQIVFRTLVDGLRLRIAARETEFQYFEANVVIGGGQMREDQRALVEHVARRALDQLERGDRLHRTYASALHGDRNAHVLPNGDETDE